VAFQILPSSSTILPFEAIYSKYRAY
jgi:hypothetical protein